MFKKSVQQQLLSYHYSGPKKAKGSKLNLFGKAIVVIDKIKEPQSLAGIRQVDLSHNGISEIQNMDQFCSVQFVNLSHNRIIEAEEVLKLQKLPRLQVVYLKGNPFLREKMDKKVVAFLLSVDTDVEIVSGEVASLISSLTSKTIQNMCYSHYLRRIDNHIQLLNNYNMDESFLNPDYAIFPKIKKLFEQNLKEISIKRQMIEAIDERCFEDEGVLTEYLKERIDAVQNERSEIIRKIYERQQLLRNVRSTYNLRVVPKKTVPRIMNGPVTVGYFSPPKLKESRKQSKIGITNTKPRVKRDQIQNSPQKKLSQSLQWREGYQEQILMNSLIKMNPLYQLLQSPLPSLKSHEKQLLIQNLSLHLKEKMKEVQKLEKKQQELNNIKMEMNDLQQHLRQMSIEFKNQQLKGNQKIKKLSNLCKEEAGRVENLCQQLTVCQEELQTLKTENSRIKAENNELKQKISLYECQEQLQDTIKDHFSKKLKKNYMQLLSKKAQHFCRLKQIKQFNQNLYQRQLKYTYFHELSFATTLAKHQKHIIKTQKVKSFRQLIEVLNNSRVNNRKQQTLSSNLSQQYMRSFMRFLKQHHKIAKINNQNIQKAKNINNKRTKMKVFSSMKQQLQQKYEQIYNQSLQKQSCLIVLRKTFRVWKKYLSSHTQKMSQCQQKIVKGTKRYFFNIFTSRCSQKLSFFASAQATQDFLCKIRKIKSYLNFTKTTSANISQRKIKCRKVELIRQHQYLFWFMSTIRDIRVKKRILAQKELHLKKQSEQQRQKQQLASKQYKLNKILMFCNRLQSMSFKVIKKILNRQKASISLESDRHQSFYKQFLALLRTNWLSNYKLNVKIEFLRKSPIIVNKIKRFFKYFSAEKTKLMRFKSKSNKDRLLKSFYKWKFYNSWSKMLAYKQMYEQLGPEISQVSELQRQVAREKQLLLLQIEEKERILMEWQRKCQDYEYMIHSKDLKYQKLKDIYAEMANQQQMSATVKLPKEKKPEQDIYLKYLPQEMKIHPATKYSFQAKLGERDEYLKGRLYTQNQTFRADIAKQSEKGGMYLKNRETFLSSFKRF